MNLQTNLKNRNHSYLGGASAVGAVALATMLQPAHAGTGDVAEVSSSITTLAGIGGAIGTIVVAVMGLRIALSFVKKVAGKA
jgi:hypothetical protein